MERQAHASRIKGYATREYVRKAKVRGERQFSIRVGEVAKALGLNARVPAVCSALKNQKWQEENRIQLVRQEGPKSGQSTTVTFTYRFRDDAPHRNLYEALMKIKGIAKGVFKEGEWEEEIHRDRENFHGGKDPWA